MAATEETETETETTAVTTPSEETTVADNREAALDADNKITELVQAAEADYNVLVNMISAGNASDLDLYDTAKKVNSNLGSYQVNVCLLYTSTSDWLIMGLPMLSTTSGR